jgi:hypothetical protein
MKRKIPCSFEKRMQYENNSFFCDKCGKIFSTFFNLKRHKDTIDCKEFNISEVLDEKNNEEENINENKNCIEVLSINSDNINKINTEIKIASEEEIYKKYLEENQKYIEKNNIIEEKKNLEKSQEGYFYIIQLREFIKTKENIYKIGMSNRLELEERMKEYPKFSHKYLELKVNSPKSFETIIKKFFDFKFKKRIEYGTEYFEGDIDKMIYYVKKQFELCCE